MPTLADRPPVHSIIIEDPEPGGPFGARGAGEIGLNAVPVGECQQRAEPCQSVALYPAPEPPGEVVAMIHDGGWTNGDREWMAFCGRALTAHGITAARLGYRLAPMHVRLAGQGSRRWCRRGPVISAPPAPRPIRTGHGSTPPHPGALNR